MSITFLPSRLLKGLLVLIIIYAEVRTYRWWSGVQPVSGTMPAWLATSVKGGGTFKRERVLVATSFGAHDGQSASSPPSCCPTQDPLHPFSS